MTKTLINIYYRSIISLVSGTARSSWWCFFCRSSIFVMNGPMIHRPKEDFLLHMRTHIYVVVSWLCRFTDSVIGGPIYYHTNCQKRHHFCTRANTLRCKENARCVYATSIIIIVSLVDATISSTSALLPPRDNCTGSSSSFSKLRFFSLLLILNKCYLHFTDRKRWRWFS